METYIVPPTPPSSPVSPMGKAHIGKKFIFGHWMDAESKWKLSPHPFIITKTKEYLIGQFITTTWFDCYIYPGKTFIIIRMLEKGSISALEEELNSTYIGPFSLKHISHVTENIEAFIIPSIKDYEMRLDKQQNIRVEIKGLNKKNILSLSLRRTSRPNTTHSVYATLPNFMFKN